MFWLISAFTVIAAWAILSVLGGERQRLLEEMRHRIATAAPPAPAPAPAPAGPIIAKSPAPKPAPRPPKAPPAKPATRR